MTALAVLAPQERTRSCGGCVECCVSHGVPGVTAQGERCIHICEKGCERYEDRPQLCSLFVCSWLDGFGEEEDRPDKTGVVCHSNILSLATPHGKKTFGRVLFVDESRQGGYEREGQESALRIAEDEGLSDSLWIRGRTKTAVVGESLRDFLREYGVI